MSGGGSPQTVQTQPPPKKEDKETQLALADATRRRRQARGYRSTVVASQMMSQTNPALGTTLGS